MVKKGIYRTVLEHFTSERHGGGTIRENFYWFLCFYVPKKTVGLFGASRYFLKPYLEDRIELKGEIIQLINNQIEFYIFNKDTGINIRFRGTVEGDQLHLSYFHENKPQEVFEDIFEYIGTGENET